MRPVLIVLLATAAAALAGDDGYDDPPPLQRYLAGLRLGDGLKDVQRIYPPVRDWPSSADSRGRVTRYRIERDGVKALPRWTHALLIGLRRGKLIDIQVIYDAQRSREKTHEDLARDLSLTYGEAERSGNKFVWSDGRTVLRVFPVEVPIIEKGDGANKEPGVEWRTSLQVLEKDLYKRVD